MRRIERIDEILNKIKEIWILNPDMRLGQLLMVYFNYPDRNLFNVEDDKFGVEVFDPNSSNGLKESLNLMKKIKEKIPKTEE